MATQNPIESEGTYPLPEAQIDRFMLKVVIGYPGHDEELHRRAASARRGPRAAPGAPLEDLMRAPASGGRHLRRRPAASYSVDIATATREPEAHGLSDIAPYISYGARPARPISLVQGRKALALIEAANTRWSTIFRLSLAMSSGIDSC